MYMLDDLDRALVHALQIDARAPFTTVAAVLGTSPQTVLRRYRRLHASAGLRVVGLADAALTSRQLWLVRITAAAATAQDIAHTLARRQDTSWVRLTSGGTEIAAIIQTAPGDAHALLLRDIPRTSSITAVSAHYLLHLYLGGPIAWRGRVDVLTPEQQEALRVPAEGAGATLGAADHALLAVLRKDGRASYTELAAATGWSASTVARRLTELRAAGTLFFDVDIDPALFGITVSAMLWMSVAPARLDEVAVELATHDELAVVASTTGSSNLFAHVLCRDAEALHHYLTRRLAFDAITRIETAPVLRTLKAAASLRDGRSP
ncbi:Lrp/AsnC family transcriptional regulator [Nonomuraea sp. NPDC050556]|uniref:Lrp/AsnC family transcriptional regulator n=1 Tax=Nonomuraea sp. NPDC050556 TaxID=3364369 RepID=UPI0037B1BC43